MQFMYSNLFVHNTEIVQYFENNYFEWSLKIRMNRYNRFKNFYGKG